MTPDFGWGTAIPLLTPTERVRWEGPGEQFEAKTVACVM